MTRQYPGPPLSSQTHTSTPKHYCTASQTTIPRSSPGSPAPGYPSPASPSNPWHWLPCPLKDTHRNSPSLAFISRSLRESWLSRLMSRWVCTCRSCLLSWLTIIWGWWICCFWFFWAVCRSLSFIWHVMCSGSCRICPISRFRWSSSG